MLFTFLIAVIVVLIHNVEYTTLSLSAVQIPSDAVALSVNCDTMDDYSKMHPRMHFEDWVKNRSDSIHPALFMDL